MSDFQITMPIRFTAYGKSVFDRLANQIWALELIRRRGRTLRPGQSLYLVAGEPARWTMRRPWRPVLR